MERQDYLYMCEVTKKCREVATVLGLEQSTANTQLSRTGRMKDDESTDAIRCRLFCLVWFCFVPYLPFGWLEVCEGAWNKGPI